MIIFIQIQQISSLGNCMNSTQQWQSVTWFEVDEHQAGQRIDNFLFSRLKGVPKSRIYRLIREGRAGQ